MSVLPDAHRHVIQPSLVCLISSEEKLDSLAALPVFSQFPSLCFCVSAHTEVAEFALKASRCPVPSLFADIYPHPSDHPQGLKSRLSLSGFGLCLKFLLAATFKGLKWEKQQQRMGKTLSGDINVF